jgi:hypothetical protein
VRHRGGRGQDGSEPSIQRALESKVGAEVCRVSRRAQRRGGVMLHLDGWREGGREGGSVVPFLGEEKEYRQGGRG